MKALAIGVSRADLVQWLENANVETRQVFAGNIMQQPGYTDIAHPIHGSLEQTDWVMCSTFFIGVYPGLDEEKLDFVAQRVGEFLRTSQGPRQWRA